jgi:Fe-S cluster assembly protein SufD
MSVDYTNRSLDWLEKLRETATRRFLELGFPTTKLEDWKYTNIAPISGTTFATGLDESSQTLPDALWAEVERFPHPRLAFLNSRWVEGTASEAGIVMENLRHALFNPDFGPVLQRHLGRYADTENQAFVAWNTSRFADGALMMIPSGAVVHEPIHLIYISTPGRQPRAVFPRNVILAGEACRLSVVEVYLSGAGGVGLTNSVTEIVAAPGAAIDYYRLELEAASHFHVSTVNAVLDRDAVLKSHSFSLGAGLARNELRVAMDGEGSECTLNGLFLVDGNRLVDNHTEIDHRRPHATSRELYKGVLTGRGAGVFNGAIVVRKDAQKTNAVQHNRNLLLSEHAQINTKPQLEIRADDVRCAHGAGIGQIDQDALFYLKTRGVDERVARRILIRGFAAEILDGVHVPAVERELQRKIDAWFETSLEAA